MIRKKMLHRSSVGCVRGLGFIRILQSPSLCARDLFSRLGRPLLTLSVTGIVAGPGQCSAACVGGDPFGDSSILPTFAVAEVARREMTVALTGDGGDEAFFGYDTFRAVRLAKTHRRLPALSRRVLRKMTGAGAGTAWGRRLEALCEYGLAPLASSFRNRMGFSEPDRRALLGSNQGDPHHTAEHIYRERLARLREVPEAYGVRRTFSDTYVPYDFTP